MSTNKTSINTANVIVLGDSNVNQYLLVISDEIINVHLHQ